MPRLAGLQTRWMPSADLPLRSRMSFPKLALTLLATCAAGCDVPTSLPRWTTDWEVVAVDKNVSTADLLPAGVRAGPGGFAIDSFGVTTSIRLGEVCELCTCFDGPIPDLDITPHDWPVQLPPGLTEAQVLEGTARLVLVNEIGFDPLDDGRGGKGWLDVVLTDRFTGADLESLSLSGTFPPGESADDRVRPRPPARALGPGCSGQRPHTRKRWLPSRAYRGDRIPRARRSAPPGGQHGGRVPVRRRARAQSPLRRAPGRARAAAAPRRRARGTGTSRWRVSCPLGPRWSCRWQPTRSSSSPARPRS